MITTNFSIGGAISFGWNLLQKHWEVMIGMMFVFFIIFYINSFFVLIACLFCIYLDAALGGTYYSYFGPLIIYFFVLLFCYAYQAGYLKLYLNATDGEEPKLNVFKTTVKKVPRLIALMLLYSIAVGLGMYLLIIPGIWLAVRLCYAPLIYLDREKCSIEEAFRESFRMTKGHDWQLIGLLFASIGVILLGLLACIAGVLPAVAVCYFAYTASYRMLQYQEGHPIAQNISENPERQI